MKTYLSHEDIYRIYLKAYNAPEKKTGVQPTPVQPLLPNAYTSTSSNSSYEPE